MSSKNSRPVYSTEFGRLCPQCEQALDACRCDEDEPIKGDGTIKVSRETKGRKGSGVTLITGIPEKKETLKATAKALKKHCGVGGTLKDGVLEIQGDQRDKVMLWLKAKGYRAVKAGG